MDRLYSLFLYCLFYGLDYFITVLSSSARIANDALNANTVGLLGANAIVMTLYYMLYDRPRWWHIIALPTLGILAATGSRKALSFLSVLVQYYSLFLKVFVVLMRSILL